jgi:hypothetical protein
MSGIAALKLRNAEYPKLPGRGLAKLVDKERRLVAIYAVDVEGYSRLMRGR